MVAEVGLNILASVMFSKFTSFLSQAAEITAQVVWLEYERILVYYWLLRRFVKYTSHDKPVWSVQSYTRRVYF